MKWYEKVNWRSIIWLIYWPSALWWGISHDGFSGYISGITLGIIIGMDSHKWITPLPAHNKGEPE